LKTFSFAGKKGYATLILNQKNKTNRRDLNPTRQRFSVN